MELFVSRVPDPGVSPDEEYDAWVTRMSAQVSQEALSEDKDSGAKADYLVRWAHDFQKILDRDYGGTSHALEEGEDLLGAIYDTGLYTILSRNNLTPDTMEEIMEVARDLANSQGLMFIDTISGDEYLPNQD